MPRLSRTQDEARQQIGRAATAGLAPADLADRIMAAIGVAIPNDGYRMFGIDPGSLLINRLLAASESDAWARREWLTEAYLASDPLTYIELPNLMRLGLTVVANQEHQQQCWGFPPDVLRQLTEREHFLAFHEIRSPVGGGLIGCFSAAGRWTAALQLYRRDRSHPFRKTDVDFLRLVVPEIGRAVAASLARERASMWAAGSRPDASGILILDRELRPRFSTPAGEQWQRLLWDAARDHHDPLPTAILASIAGLRADPSLVSGGAVLAPTSAGLIRIEASPAGPDGSVAVVIAPHEPPPLPEPPLDWPLTTQERQVVTLLLRGLDMDEISGKLFITEATLRTHLRHVYDKLNVSSRTQLLRRYFHDTSDIIAPDPPPDTPSR